MDLKASVMVEGPSDKALVELLVLKLGLNQSCQIYCYAKHGLIKVAKALLSDNSRARLVCLMDLDNMDEAQLTASVGNKLASIGKATLISNLQWRFDFGATFYPIPVGLPGDPDLKALGIQRHAMESHLLRFLFNHPEKCLHERTGKQIRDPKSLLKQILPIARQHDPPLDSAKDVFQLLMGVLGRTRKFEDWLKSC